MTFFSLTILYVLTLSFWKLDFCEGVYGGNLATGEQVPWTILITSSIEHGVVEISMCSGTLISMDLVLTAAHCVQNKEVYHRALTLRAGVSLKSRIQQRKATYCASRILKSPIKWGEFDLAVVKADKPFDEAYGVSPVNIATENFIPGTECVMAGHGRRPAGTNGGNNVVMLKQIIVDCSTEVTRCKKDHLIGPQPRDICPVAKEGGGLCKGDSGSGLICNGSVYGVAHAIAYSSDEPNEHLGTSVEDECEAVALSIYVALWPYKHWIHGAIAQLKANAQNETVTATASSLHAHPRFSFWKRRASTRFVGVLQGIFVSTVLSLLLKA